MKKVYWTLGILLLVILLVFGLQLLASERVEVVELHTLDAGGEEITTRLWIVDDSGFQYLRSSDIGSGWGARVLASAAVELTRAGQRASYTAVRRADKLPLINSLMQEKYTWGDSFIALLVGDRGASTPLELHPVD